MDDRPVIVEMATPIGSLVLPEGLLQALTGNRGDEGVTRVTDLPSVVVGLILSRIPNPVDIASAFKASRLFWGVARSAPFRLQLRTSRYQDGGSFVGSGDDQALPNRTENGAQKLVAWTRAALTGIRSIMRSTQLLDLAGCPILDDDVGAVLVDLCCLDCLVLDGCQKLTSSVTHALAVSVRSGPRVLSLQRCFGLGPAAAGNLLAAAAVDGSRLQAILLSHLDRLDLPREPPLLEPVGDGNCKEIGDNVEVIKNIGSSSPGAGLCILALHNCGSLGYSELVAISKTCPYLEVLMLGGSVGGLGLTRPDILPQEKVLAATSALVGAVERLSRLQILEITFFTTTVSQAVREQISKCIYVWDFCEKNSVATAAAVVAGLKSPTRSLHGEDYVFRFSEDPAMACDRLSENTGDQSDSENFQCQKGDRGLEGVNVGKRFLSERVVAQCSYPHQVFCPKWDCFAEDILMALRAGANCSDARRRTPLHVAAGWGEPAMVANLLSIGAAARGMKDSRGATALFVAAESGHAQVCEHLLRGGADVLASNRGGETPLYIAALRGHSAAVAVMLAHCQEHGVNWQDANVYGDGWTPLMAATVADRQDVGKVLLWAAGMPSNSVSLKGQVGSEFKMEAICWQHGRQVGDKDVIIQDDNASAVSSRSSAGEDVIASTVPTLPMSSLQLLDAQNRYGQTALHIAARQGSLWFVSNLLQAGTSLDIRDAYGLRAVHVARKHNHSIVEKLLEQWEEEHMDVNDARRGSTSKKQLGARKKVTSASKRSLGGNLANHNSSRHGALSRSPKPKNPSVMKRESMDVTYNTDSRAESSDSTLELELLSLPDSPTSIVPSWMHLSPPVSPHQEEVPAVMAEHRDIDDVDEKVSIEADPSQAHDDRVEDSQNYLRGRGIRRRTAPVDRSTSISADD